MKNAFLTKNHNVQKFHKTSVVTLSENKLNDLNLRSIKSNSKPDKMEKKNLVGQRYSLRGNLLQQNFQAGVQLAVMHCKKNTQSIN